MQEFASFYSYDNITLKLYLEINSTSKYKRVVRRGWATQKDCEEKWEEIIAANTSASGDYSYDNYMEELQGYALLLNEYNLVRSLLLKASIQKFDKETIEELDGLGYKINMSSLKEYDKTLALAYTRSNSLITEIKIKIKDIERINGGGKATTKNITLEQMLAGMSMRIGFPIHDDITLARFNEYKRLINKSNGRDKKG